MKTTNHFIDAIERSIWNIKKEFNGIPSKERIDYFISKIEARLYELAYCSDCPRVTECTMLCIDSVNGWLDILIEHADEYERKRAELYGED